jgi:hypothetical protein
VPDNSGIRRPASPVQGQPNFLSQKIAGIPVWAILVVVAVGVYVYLEKKKKTTTATTTTSTAAGTTTSPVTGPVNYLEQGLAANASAATTNPQWEANAEAVLNGYGYPFVQVQAALNQYLAGGVLSSIQQEIVNAAIEAVGAPPSPPATAPTGTSNPQPTPPATSTPSPPAVSSPPPATVTPQPVAPSGGIQYTSTPEGAQMSPAANAAFQGTTIVDNEPYNVYNASELSGGQSGLAAVAQAIEDLYPGVQKGTPAWTAAANDLIAGGGGTIAVPVFPGEPTTGIPSSEV